MKGKRLLVVSVCLGLLVAMALLTACWRENVSLTAQGITNLDSLTLSQNLVVGGTSNLKGVLSDSANSVRINDNVLITGTLGIQGPVSDQGTLFRINDNSLVTGTLGVSSQVSSDGLYSTNNISTTQTVSTKDLVVSGVVSDLGYPFKINDNTTITGTLGVSSQITADGLYSTNNISTTQNLSAVDLIVSGNVSDVGATFRINDPAIITGGLGILGEIYDSGGDVRIADNVLITGTLGASGAVTFGDALAVMGPVSDQGAVFRIEDNTWITGSLYASDGLEVAGNVYDSGATFRVNDNVLITGTLGVSSQITADGLYSTNAISSSGLLTITNWAQFQGMVLQPAATLAITANYGITPTNYSVIYLEDDGGQATDTVTLDSTTSIVDGSYLGQLLLVIYIDTDGATMTIKNAANTRLPSAGDLALGLNDSALFYWNGDDWLCISHEDL